MKQEGENSGSRRTRSQRAPDWTVEECLVLVNVIAAVEADCLKALSTYQKWEIIAENCTSLDVVRTFNQCRRKWDSLLAERDVIKQWEFKMQDDSYWRLGSRKKREFGLPESFDEELFKAIDTLATMRENQSDSEPDGDPEAGVEMLDDIEEPGPKRQRRRSTPKKNNALDKSPKSEAKEEPASFSEEDPCEGHIKSDEEKETDSVEWEEQMMAEKLLENAERIQAIVSENAEYATSDGKNVEDHDRTDFVRCQGDKLIACLGDIQSTINVLNVLLQDWE